MTNQNTVNLTLFQPLVYNREDFDSNSDYTSIYDALIRKLDKEDVGSEACIEFNYTCKDNIKINSEKVGFALPPTEEVRKAVLEGKEIPLPEHNMQIKAGKYEFIQLNFLPQKEDLFATLLPIICVNDIKEKGTFHLRLLKENAFVIICQIILSKE